jgi:hypothetical protein
MNTTLFRANWPSYSLAFILPCMALIVGPVYHLDWLKLMPGDVGDARLNNFFLENIFLFLIGKSSSLIHLEFFYPFKYVGGFSDNLFGSSPIYIIARAIHFTPETSFQIWFLVSYLTNYVAAFFGLRLLGISIELSAIGALIFAFSLPVTGQISHAQLSYRFGVPLTCSYFILFLQNCNYRTLLISMSWLVWQFYCSIYIGILISFLLIAIVISFLIIKFINLNLGLPTFFQFRNKLAVNFKFFFTGFCILSILMFVLMHPYMQTQALYSFNRHLSEVAMMLPHPKSYLLSDASWLWSMFNLKIDGIDMPHEHQLFIGMVPLGLLVSACIPSIERKYLFACLIFSLATLILVILTLRFQHHLGFWQYIYEYPPLNAIRAVTRLILVLLFPISYLSVIGLQKLLKSNFIKAKFFFPIVLMILSFEFSAVNFYTSPKLVWQERVAQAMSKVPADLPKSSILFFAQKNGPFFADEIDAMWASLILNQSTLNGYSGNLPKGYRHEFGLDCTEAIKRLESVKNFNLKNNTNYDENFLKRMIFIGFDDCKL